MPGSGNEETRVKPSVGQFSDYSAGIPIKKRRFSLLWTQPTEDSTPPTENDSDQKGVSNASSVAAGLTSSDVVVTPSTSGVVVSQPSSGFTSSSNTSGVATSSNTSSVVGSSIASNVVGSSVASGVSTTLNACTVAASSYASSAALSSNASSVIAGAKPSSAVETSKASSILESVSNISDACEKIITKKEKKSSDDTNGSMLQHNSNLIRIKLEEQSFTFQSKSFAEIDIKMKHMETSESDNNPRKSAKSELDLASNDSLTLNIGKAVYAQQNTYGKCKSELPKVCANPGLSLGLGEHLVSATASGITVHSGQSHENQELVSLNLSLSKGERSTQLGSNDVMNGGNMLADRSNWDLNTTMDVWDGPASERNAHMEDIEPLVCSTGMTGSIIHVQTNFTSSLPSQQFNNEDSLHSGFTIPYSRVNSNEKPSNSSVKPGQSVAASNLNMGNLKSVKSEPLDESITASAARVKDDSRGLFNMAQVKPELVEKFNSESTKSSTLITLKSVEVRSEKPEPVHECNREAPKRMEASLNHSDGKMLRLVDTTKEHTSTNLSLHHDASIYMERLVQAKETKPSAELQVASEMISSVGCDVNKSNIYGKIEHFTSENKNVKDSDHRGLNITDVQLPDSRGTVEGSVSDEEKINLSGDILEEDSYGSAYESYGNNDVAAAMDMGHDGKAEDDFEDGEVREPVENSQVEPLVCEEQEVENGGNGDTGYKIFKSVGFGSDKNPFSSSIKEKETQREDPGKTDNNTVGKCVETSLDKDSNREADRYACLQELSSVEIPSSQSDKMKPIEAMRREPLDISEQKDVVEAQEGEHTSKQVSDIREGTPMAISHSEDDAEKLDSEGKTNSALPQAEAFLNGNDEGKDVDNGGNKSRIINLSRAFTMPSPDRAIFMSRRTQQSRVGREQLLDVALGADKFHPRGRDEVHGSSYHRFSRERHHDQPSRNSRINFMRGRGRISSRIDTCGDSKRNFASEFYTGSTEFSVVGHKFVSAVSDADLDFNRYNNGQDDTYFGTRRGGRKISSNDSSIIPRLPPRRRSPGGRGGQERGLPMVRRVPRNLSPSRCIGEDDSELVRLRHMRGFADDHADTVFARTQPSFEGLDGPFVRANREFSSTQRGLPRIRSKSPTRPRTRSPGQWSSPRRSPEGFGGPIDLPHRRLPPIYRMERIRSPDRSCFAREMVLRRHGSPSFMSRSSNDLRYMDLGQDHGPSRPDIPNRSPSGRILLRNRRQLDLVDPRERNDGEDYYGGSMPSGRFHELGSDENADERSYGDRRGPVRPFRPPYSDADTENFHLNAEGGPRSFRFCPEDDPELHGKGNMRGREFDRRIKSRPGNPPRRTRNIEDQEGNFRYSAQVWHDDGYDDVLRVKRKRF